MAVGEERVGSSGGVLGATANDGKAIAESADGGADATGGLGDGWLVQNQLLSLMETLNTKMKYGAGTEPAKLSLAITASRVCHHRRPRKYPTSILGATSDMQMRQDVMAEENKKLVEENMRAVEEQMKAAVANATSPMGRAGGKRHVVAAKSGSRFTEKGDVDGGGGDDDDDASHAVIGRYVACLCLLPIKTTTGNRRV